MEKDLDLDLDVRSRVSDVRWWRKPWENINRWYEKVFDVSDDLLMECGAMNALYLRWGDIMKQSCDHSSQLIITNQSGLQLTMSDNFMRLSRHTRWAGCLTGEIASCMTCWGFSVLLVCVRIMSEWIVKKDLDLDSGTGIRVGDVPMWRKWWENVSTSYEKVFHLTDDLLLDCGAICAIDWWWNDLMITHNGLQQIMSDDRIISII